MDNVRQLAFAALAVAVAMVDILGHRPPPQPPDPPPRRVQAATEAGTNPVVVRTWQYSTNTTSTRTEEPGPGLWYDPALKAEVLNPAPSRKWVRETEAAVEGFDWCWFNTTGRVVTATTTLSDVEVEWAQRTVELADFRGQPMTVTYWAPVKTNDVKGLVWLGQFWAEAYTNVVWTDGAMTNNAYPAGYPAGTNYGVLERTR